MAELRVERDLKKGARPIAGVPVFRDGFVEVPFLVGGRRVAWARYTDAEWDALPSRLPVKLVDKGRDMKAEASSVEAPKVA